MTTQENWKCHGGGSPEREGSLLQQNGEAALRKGPWTKEEDEILLKFVKEKGIVKWTSIGKQTGLARSGKSCRLRWLNHLRPNLKKGSFTKEEENLIVCLHSKYGNKWTRIASKLPGRTDNEIKNFWNTRLKKCQKKQLPIYPETMEDDHSPVVDFNYNFNPNFHTDFLDKSDFNQSLQSRASAPTQTPLSSLHQFSSTLPHSWSIEQLPSPTCPPTQSFTRHFSSHPPSSPHHFLSQNQFSPTHQSTGYFSSMHHSRPASYQSMQGFLSSPSMPPPATISSLQKSNMSSLAGHSSNCHSTHPLIMPSTCASTPIQYPCMSSLDFGQFRHFKRSGGRLPRPLSAPLMSSTPNSQEPFHSSVSPLNIDTTRTSTGSTFQLNYSSAGPSNCSFIGSPLSVDMTWPSISRGMNDPVSPNSSFTLKAEPPSIQSYPTAPAAQRDPCDTSLMQINAQSMISLDLLNAQLQEDLANRGCQNPRKEDLLGQNLNGESLLTECKKTKDSSNNTSRKGNLSSEISKAEIPSDEYSIKDGRLAQSSKTMDSSGSSLNTENSSYESTRRKEFNTGSNLTGLLIEGSDFMKCLEMEDSLLGKSSIIGCSITKNITTEGESEQESREDLLEEDSGRECLWTDSGYTDELVIGASSCEGDLWNKFSNRDDLADTSASQNINSLTSNSCKQSLLKSQRQNHVLDIDQNSTSFMLEPDGLGSKSSYTKTSAGQKGPIETEDHIDNELSSLLDFFPIASELPEWYNSSQEISSNKATF